MGFLDFLKPQSTTPTVPSVLPDAARQPILRGQLPTLEPNYLFLKNGETCHYADRAIYEKRTVNKKRIRKNTGYSMPGLFKGTLVHVGGADGFDRKTDDLVAVTPYANCIEFRFSKETLKLFVPDGNLPHIVLKLI